MQHDHPLRSTFRFGSVDFSLIRKPELRPLLRVWSAQPDQSRSITLTGAHGVAESLADDRVQQAHDDADLVLCDGTPPYVAAVLSGHGAVVDRIPGLVAMLELSSEAAALGLQQAFVGGPPGVAEKTKRGLEEAIGRPIDGWTWSPPFVPEIDQTFVDMVADRLRGLRQPVVVWIGLSTPKQEVLVAGLKRNLPGGCLFVAVGAAFDIYAGTIVRPPELISKLGMAWLHRCVYEPRRLVPRYASALPVVMRGLLAAAWTGVRRKP